MTVFAQFKSNQGLTVYDLSRILDKTPSEIRGWLKDGAPPSIERIARVCNDILERQKLHDMPDIDRQHFEHRAELLTKEIEALKSEIRQLKMADVSHETAHKTTAQLMTDEKLSIAYLKAGFWPTRKFNIEPDDIRGAADPRGRFGVPSAVVDSGMGLYSKDTQIKLSKIFNAEYKEYEDAS